ncbi:MAG: hypothetical protein AB7P04_04705 [Bacteriovoracia bacterium]
MKKRKPNSRLVSRAFGVLFPTYLALATGCGGGGGGGAMTVQYPPEKHDRVFDNSSDLAAANAAGSGVARSIAGAFGAADKELSKSSAIKAGDQPVSLAGRAPKGIGSGNQDNERGASPGAGTTPSGRTGGGAGGGVTAPGMNFGAFNGPGATVPAPGGAEFLGNQGGEGVYSQGSGAARAPAAAGGSGNPFAGLFGGNDNAVGGEAKKELQFGAKGPGFNPMGSTDPEDYFSRIGLTENIFLIVERKYRQKTSDWATSDAERAANQRKP